MGYPESGETAILRLPVSFFSVSPCPPVSVSLFPPSPYLFSPHPPISPSCLSPCPPVSVSFFLRVSGSPRLRVSVAPCLRVPPSPCLCCPASYSARSGSARFGSRHSAHQNRPFFFHVRLDGLDHFAVQMLETSLQLEIFAYREPFGLDR